MFRHLVSHLPFFSSVARHLNFSQAADELALSQSAVSYQIQALEQKLGFKLFIRGKGSKVELSEKGELLLNQYLQAEKGFNQVLTEVQIYQQKPIIKVTAPVDFGVKVLTPLLSNLEHVGLRIELELNDNLVPLQKSQFDLSIRNNKNEENLNYIELAEVENILLCSKEYSLQHTLSSIETVLPHYRLLVRNKHKSASWQSLFESNKQDFSKHKNKQVISNSFGIFTAAEAGLGLAILPAYFIEEKAKHGNLRIIDLPHQPLPPTKFYIAFQQSSVAHNWALKIKELVTNQMTCLD